MCTNVARIFDKYCCNRGIKSTEKCNVRIDDTRHAILSVAKINVYNNNIVIYGMIGSSAIRTY